MTVQALAHLFQKPSNWLNSTADSQILCVVTHAPESAPM